MELGTDFHSILIKSSNPHIVTLSKSDFLDSQKLSWTKMGKWRFVFLPYPEYDSTLGNFWNVHLYWQALPTLEFSWKLPQTGRLVLLLAMGGTEPQWVQGRTEKVPSLTSVYSKHLAQHLACPWKSPVNHFSGLKLEASNKLQLNKGNGFQRLTMEYLYFSHCRSDFIAENTDF